MEIALLGRPDKLKFLDLIATSCLPHHHLSPGHHIDGGSLAEILVGRSATRWLRLNGRLCSSQRTLSSPLRLGRLFPAQLRASKDSGYFDEAETFKTLNHRTFVIGPDVRDNRRAAFF